MGVSRRILRSVGLGVDDYCVSEAGVFLHRSGEVQVIDLVKSEDPKTSSEIYKSEPGSGVFVVDCVDYRVLLVEFLLFDEKTNWTLLEVDSREERIATWGEFEDSAGVLLDASLTNREFLVGGHGKASALFRMVQDGSSARRVEELEELNLGSSELRLGRDYLYELGGEAVSRIDRMTFEVVSVGYFDVPVWDVFELH
jgi:hypothetical protein